MAVLKIKKHEKTFVILQKEALDHPTLSWEAKGLWAHLMGRPDDWKPSVAQLVQQFPAGRDKILRIFGELIEAGLCSKQTIRSADGTFSEVEYTVYEDSILFKKCLPRPENPYPENPVAVSGASPYLHTKERKEIKSSSNLSRNHERARKLSTEAAAFFQKYSPFVKLMLSLSDEDVEALYALFKLKEASIEEPVAWLVIAIKKSYWKEPNNQSLSSEKINKKLATSFEQIFRKSGTIRLTSMSLANEPPGRAGWEWFFDDPKFWMKLEAYLKSIGRQDVIQMLDKIRQEGG